MLIRLPSVNVAAPPGARTVTFATDRRSVAVARRRQTIHPRSQISSSAAEILHSSSTAVIAISRQVVDGYAIW